MKNIYLFHGEESFLIEEEIGKLKKKCGVATASSGFQSFTDNTLELTALVQAIQSTTLFEPQKLLLVDWKPFIANFPEDEKLQKMLFTALETCPETITVVFRARGKVDLRKKAAKWLQKNAKVQEFKAYAPWEKDKIKGWVINRSIAKGKRIGPEAVELLIETTGLNLHLLDQEIQKLVVYKDKEKEITVKDVQALASPGEIGTFELIDLLRKKDIKRALVLLNKLKNETEPIAVLGLIVAQFRLYLQISQAQRNGIAMQAVARKVGKKIFYLEQLAKDLRRYSLEKLKSIYLQLQSADLAIKTGQEQAWPALERLILSF